MEREDVRIDSQLPSSVEVHDLEKVFFLSVDELL